MRLDMHQILLLRGRCIRHPRQSNIRPEAFAGVVFPADVAEAINRALDEVEALRALARPLGLAAIDLEREVADPEDSGAMRRLRHAIAVLEGRE